VQEWDRKRKKLVSGRDVIIEEDIIDIVEEAIVEEHILERS
jgi:ribosome-associated protein YbcJ (S4-like RNA binding protein)